MHTLPRAAFGIRAREECSYGHGYTLNTNELVGHRFLDLDTEFYGFTNPDYRLRVGHYRVFYTVTDETRTVEILRVMHEAQTEACYEEPEQ